MKKCMMIFFSLLLFFPALVGAEKFLGAPVIPQGKAIDKTKARLELKTNLSHDEVLAFYKEALKEVSDIKYRDWAEATYIEDDGARKWHSITISKADKDGATVIILKDNWTWIIGTLILRYIGVFVVLLVLFLGMNVSGSIISRSVKKMEAKKAEG